METIAQMITPDTEPDPAGEPGERRIKQHVAPDRRISIEDKDIRHGRTSSSKTFNGFKEHFAGDLESKVTREVVVRPAHEPEHEVVEWLAEALEKAPGLLQLDVDLGSMASPRMAQWAEQGVSILARPWPHIGPLFTKQDFTLDFARMQVTCPGGQRVPMVPGRHVQFPAAACDACALRAQCTKATHGQGRSLSIREDEQFQQKLRAKMNWSLAFSCCPILVQTENVARQEDNCSLWQPPDTRALAEYGRVHNGGGGPHQRETATRP